MEVAELILLISYSRTCLRDFTFITLYVFVIYFFKLGSKQKEEREGKNDELLLTLQTKQKSEFPG